MNAFLEEALSAHPGTVAVKVCDLEGRVLYERAADRVFHSASLIKVPLLVRALQRVQSGDLDLTARVVMRPEDRVPGSGVLHDLGEGLAPTLRDLLTLMIVVSDNTATNMVIDVLGEDDVNAFLRAEGLRDTDLVGKLQLPPERKNARQLAGERNRTSARDMAGLLVRLAGEAMLDAGHTELALDILSRQQLRDIVGRPVPRGEDGELRYRVASKSGELTGVHHDMGIVWTPRPLVIAMLSDGGLDVREHPDNRDVAVLARVCERLLLMFGEG